MKALLLFKRTIAVGILATALSAGAADPGGTPGLVKAVFKGSAFDTTGDIFANAIGYIIAPDEIK